MGNRQSNRDEKDIPSSVKRTSFDQNNSDAHRIYTAERGDEALAKPVTSRVQIEDNNNANQTSNATANNIDTTRNKQTFPKQKKTSVSSNRTLISESGKISNNSKRAFAKQTTRHRFQDSKVKTSQQRYVNSQLLEESENPAFDEIAEASSDAEYELPVLLKRKLAKRVNSALDEVDLTASRVDYTLYQYPFENIVLEGGGNKGLAYCGAIRVLEEIGAWQNVRRIGGASAGAMTAALLSVGYNSEEIEEFLSQDLRRVFFDATCGYVSLLPNLMRKYGWNPGKRIYKWFGQKIANQTGNADTTFQDIYDHYNIELCVVVTNLNQMSTEYCHIKTTPDLPVRMAVRMSMSIPGMFTAAIYEHDGQRDVYVDGGVLCNYPIHIYDGWWLSMKNDDSFLRRLQPLSALPELFEKKERFGTYNDKTLGFLLYADNEQDVLRTNLEKRIGVEMSAYPDTSLARERLAKKVLQERAVKEHRKVAAAVDAFLKVLNKHNLDNDDKISRSELEAAFNDENEFSKKQAKILFGSEVTVQEAFDILDYDKDGIIEYQELAKFIEGNGISFQARFLGYRRREVKNIFTFFNTLQSTLLTNVKRIYVEERDSDRTVGINTGYIGTNDFKLHPDDRRFLVDRGRRATVAYLKYYVAKNKPPKIKNVVTSISEEIETKSGIPSNDDDSEDKTNMANVLNSPSALNLRSVIQKVADNSILPANDEQDSKPLYVTRLAIGPTDRIQRDIAAAHD